MRSVEKAPHTEPMELERRELARTLGRGEPVSVEVLVAALGDEAYARNLLASRSNARLLEHLIAHPPPRGARHTATVDLAARAAAAIVRWGASGFSVVDDATLNRRRTACLACPHLTSSDALIDKLAAGTVDSAMVCGLCGCGVRKKSKLPSERCPAPHPDEPGMTRWGEPSTASHDAATSR